MDDSPLPFGDGADPASGAVVSRCQRIAASLAFQNLILATIVVNAAVLGLETSSVLVAQFGGAVFSGINHLVQALFVVEMAIRLTAHWPRPLRFFRGGWNTFDFTVVALAFRPESGGLSNIARLARLARATRLVSALPELRLIFETLLRSLPSITHILLLLGLFLYIYGILGFRLFAATDPAHWGSLGASILTLFQVLTLEGWIDIQDELIAAHGWSWVFFTSFIVFAVLVITNLFVAVIVNNLEAAKRAGSEKFDREVPGAPMAKIAAIREALDTLEHDIHLAEHEIRSTRRDPSQ